MRVVDLSVMKFPAFWLLPFANAFADVPRFCTIGADVVTFFVFLLVVVSPPYPPKMEI